MRHHLSLWFSFTAQQLQQGGLVRLGVVLFKSSAGTNSPTLTESLTSDPSCLHSHLRYLSGTERWHRAVLRVSIRTVC
ncbi:hypothetical protein QQF64_004207 [Cirrhinus molitorella]|uniref:Secreted protein n=1 Tax=Cirrhinus molitorella TaxID=172907 RepID=A0ABR3MFI1_9TELE